LQGITLQHFFTLKITLKHFAVTGDHPEAFYPEDFLLLQGVSRGAMLDCVHAARVASGGIPPNQRDKALSTLDCHEPVVPVALFMRCRPPRGLWRNSPTSKRQSILLSSLLLSA